MKKLFFAFLVSTLAFTARADSKNILFETDTDNAISIYVAQGTGPGSLLKLIYPGKWDFSPMTLLMVEYSQPMTIFRMPARMNVGLVQNMAYHSNGGRGLSFFAGGISWDITLLWWRGFYLGAGVGPYMRDSYDEYVSSRLVFGERFFIGKNIADNFHMELFTMHFSNGDFTPVNRGFNYAGLMARYSF